MGSLQKSNILFKLSSNDYENILVIILLIWNTLLKWCNLKKDNTLEAKKTTWHAIQWFCKNRCIQNKWCFTYFHICVAPEEKRTRNTAKCFCHTYTPNWRKTWIMYFNSAISCQLGGWDSFRPTLNTRQNCLSCDPYNFSNMFEFG